MNKIIITIALIVSVCSAALFTEQEYQDAFTQWMLVHQKGYGSSDFQYRYSVFKTNMDYVSAWNAAGSSTVLGLNVFADITNKEYQQIYLGTHIDATERLKNAPRPSAPRANVYNNTVDWREKGFVTAIKNQGQCGSCWSFSTTGSVEGAHAQKTGNLVSLSEQNLMDCSTAQGNEGCNGGLMDQAFEYIISNKGIDTEASYPYQGADGTCAFKASDVGATISSYKDVTSGDENALLEAANQQPVSVAIDASHISFQLYTGGVYHSILCSTTKLDHGVLVVGYGVDSSNGDNYWIVKNSWGDSWGLAGYIMMSRDRDNNCGIATSASYPIV